MKHSRTAPSGASKRTRVPTPDRAHRSSSHLEEGPAPSRAAGAMPPAAAPAAREPPEPPGSTPSPLFHTADGVLAWHTAAMDSLRDLAAAADEGSRRPRKRLFSRREIRRRSRDAFTEVASLLDLAAAALDTAAPG
jgi:hypothetical protein